MEGMENSSKGCDVLPKKRRYSPGNQAMFSTLTWQRMALSAWLELSILSKKWPSSLYTEPCEWHLQETHMHIMNKQMQSLSLSITTTIHRNHPPHSITTATNHHHVPQSFDHCQLTTMWQHHITSPIDKGPQQPGTSTDVPHHSDSDNASHCHCPHEFRWAPPLCSCLCSHKKQEPCCHQWWGNQ